MRYALATLLLLAALAARALSPAAVAREGTQVLPLRAVVEWAGGTVTYDPATAAITAALGGHTAVVKQRQSAATVDGAAVTLPLACPNVRGAVYAPLALFAAHLALPAAANADTREVTLTRADGATLVLPILEERIVFASAGTIFSIRPDGTDLKRLTAAKTGGSSPVVSPDGTKIAYIQDDRLYIMKTDGSGTKALSATRVKASDPSFSPEGDRIVYLADGEARVIRADGTGEVVVARPSRGESVESALFLPDGKEVVIAIVDKSRVNHKTFQGDKWLRVERVAAAGGARRVVGKTEATTLDTDVWGTALRPDGRALLIGLGTWGDFRHGDIVAVDLATGKTRSLVKSGCDDGRHGPDEWTCDWPACSPDGTYMAYVSATWDPDFESPDWPAVKNHRSHVALRDMSGANKRSATRAAGGFIYSPTFSPDSTRLAFLQDGNVFVVNLDGTGLLQLTKRGNNAGACWALCR